jgi:hypothetical protein
MVCCTFIAVGQPRNNTNSPSLIFPSNRYLFLIETSQAMQKRLEGMAQSVEGLLSSALASQARQGDTLGLWTFNEDLVAGQFPLQHWSAETQKPITDRIIGFLKTQKYEKQARLDRVIPGLDRIVKNSAFITVILVCVGDEEIHGTPFDKRINEFFRTWRLKQQESGKPFVVAMRAQRGQFVECAMNPAPWPAELPALPKELFVPLPAPAPVVSAPKTSSVPPLIISGRKAAVTSPRSSGVTDSKAQTNSNATLVQASNAPVVGAQADSSSIRPPLAAEFGNSGVTPGGTTNRTALADSSTSHVAVSSQGGAVSSANQAIAAATPPEHAPVDAPSPVSPVTNSSALAAPAPAAKVPSDNSVSATEKFNTAKPALAPVEVATTASNQAVSSLVIWGVGTGVVVLAAAAMWLWRRRSRPVQQISLITESIDRRKS